MAIPFAIAAVVGRAAIAAVRVAVSAARMGAQAAQQSGNQQQQQQQNIWQTTKKDKENAHQSNLKEINRMTDDIQKELIQKIQKQIGMDDITFTGNLRKNIKGDFWGSFKTVVADTPYAYFVEFGLPAGKWVNFDALKLWVEGKLGITEDRVLGIDT